MTSSRRPAPRVATRAIGPSLPRASLLGRLLALLALALLALAARPARACSVCACGDPLLTSTDPAALSGTLRFQVDAEYLRMDAANDANPAATDELTQWSYRLNAAWRPLDRLSLSLTVPYVERVIRTTGAGPMVTASSLAGLGDLELGARLTVWRSIHVGHQLDQELAVSAGASLPTGEHQAKDASGAVIDPHGQVGTGGWGPYAGLHYRVSSGRFSAFAAAAYRVRTEASYADPGGAFKYKFGDAVQWSVHGQWQPTRRLVLDLGLDGRQARRDEATDPAGARAPVDNTGGAVVSLAPALYANAWRDVWVFVRAQAPVHQSLNDRQDVKASYTAGLQFQVL